MRLSVGGGKQLLVGSGSKCDVVLDEPGVAERHAYLRGRDDGTIELHDLGSQGGTFVDGERVATRILRGGERVTLGGTELEIVHEDVQPLLTGERGALPIRTVGAAAAVLAVAGIGLALAGVFSGGGGKAPSTTFQTPQATGLPGISSLDDVDSGVGVAALPRLKARPGIETIMQDDATFLYGKSDEDVAASMKKAKDLGVDRIRLTAGWSVLAPEADADQKPEFDASDPDAYTRNGWTKYDPIGHWQVLDRAVRLAKEAGMEVMIDVGFWAPKWATSGDPKTERRTFNINPEAYADFVKSVIRRYNGDYVPKYGLAPPPDQQGSADSDLVQSVLGSLGGNKQQAAQPGKATNPKPSGPPLPKVSLWTVWNEPNHLGFIQPQWRREGSRLVPNSGHIYRSLVHAAFPAIKGIQPDAKILVGATSSTGPRKVRSETDGTPPLAFIRAMACVDAKLRPITSGPCANFKPIPGDGYSHHPYSLLHTPDYSDKRNPDNAGIGDLGRLSKLLNRLAAMRRIDPKVRDLYLTEFGYESNPPDPIKPFSPQEQARFINWSEYLAWKNPQVKMFPQFLLKDMGTVSAEAAARGKREYGDWQSGLFFNDGSPKPAASSFPLALHVDCTMAGKKNKLLVIWGHVRPGSGPRPVTLEQGKASFKPAASAASLAKGVVRAASVTPFSTDQNGYFLRFAPYKKGHTYRVRADGAGTGLAVPPDTCKGVTKQKRLNKAGRHEF